MISKKELIETILSSAATSYWTLAPILPAFLIPPMRLITNLRLQEIAFAIGCLALFILMVKLSFYCGARVKTFAESLVARGTGLVASSVILILALFTQIGRNAFSDLSRFDDVGSQALLIYEGAWVILIAYLAKPFWDRAVKVHQPA